MRDSAGRNEEAKPLATASGFFCAVDMSEDGSRWLEYLCVEWGSRSHGGWEFPSKFLNIQRKPN
ncbi:hypothetical protein LBMAG46_23860 [Planctomycetia bacterium]|nr:hypothetical protein LBMAG46_23860 [Planctomycetia bacterium]